MARCDSVLARACGLSRDRVFDPHRSAYARDDSVGHDPDDFHVLLRGVDSHDLVISIRAFRAQFDRLFVDLVEAPQHDLVADACGYYGSVLHRLFAMSLGPALERHDPAVGQSCPLPMPSGCAAVCALKRARATLPGAGRAANLGWCACGALVRVDGFRDRPAYSEFFRSGLCQDCQDCAFLSFDETGDISHAVRRGLVVGSQVSAGAVAALPFLFTRPGRPIAWEARHCVLVGPEGSPCDPWGDFEPLAELLAEHQIRVHETDAADDPAVSACPRSCPGPIAACSIRAPPPWRSPPSRPVSAWPMRSLGATSSARPSTPCTALPCVQG